MRTVDRVHLLKEDLDWAPRGITRLHKAIVGSLVVGATVPALMKFGPMVWFVPGIVAPIALRVANRSARAMARHQLDKYARGEVDLNRLRDESDGQFLHVRGRVEAETTLPGLIEQTPAVYRRLQVSLGSIQLIHEAAVDFSLTDDRGQRIRVLSSDSRLLCPMNRRYLIDGDRETRVLSEVRRGHINLMLRQRGLDKFETMGEEFLVQPGDAVDVVGFKTQIVDPSVAERLARDNPFRTALCSGRHMPLLISADSLGGRPAPRARARE